MLCLACSGGQGIVVHILRLLNGRSRLMLCSDVDAWEILGRLTLRDWSSPGYLGTRAPGYPGTRALHFALSPAALCTYALLSARFRS